MKQSLLLERLLNVDRELHSIIEELKPERSKSSAAKEESTKRRILDKFIKTGELSKEDERFCERTGWDPLDEMEVREEYVEKIKRIAEGPHTPMTPEELDKLLGLK